LPPEFALYIATNVSSVFSPRSRSTFMKTFFAIDGRTAQRAVALELPLIHIGAHVAVIAQHAGIQLRANEARIETPVCAVHRGERPIERLLRVQRHRTTERGITHRGRISSRWRLPSRWYSVSELSPGGTHMEVFFADTSPMIQAYYADGARVVKVADQRAKVPVQLQWLDSALSGSKADWKVVVGHHPIYMGRATQPLPADVSHRHMREVGGMGDSDVCSFHSGFVSCTTDHSSLRVAYRDFRGIELHVVDIPRHI
jgi:hypothetical protein